MVANRSRFHPSIVKKYRLIVLVYAVVVLFMSEGSAMLEELMLILFSYSSLSSDEEIIICYAVAIGILVVCALIVEWLDSKYRGHEGPDVFTISVRASLLPFALPRLSISISVFKVILLVGSLQLSQAFYNYGHYLLFLDWASSNKEFTILLTLSVWILTLFFAAYFSYTIIPSISQDKLHSGSSLFTRIDPRHQARIVGTRSPTL